MKPDNIDQIRGGGFSDVSATLTSAQILNSFSSPILLVAGQAGKIIVPVLVAVRYFYIAPLYGNTGVTGVGLGWSGLTSFIGPDFSPFLTNTSNWIRGYAMSIDLAAPATGLDLVFKSVGANPTAGNSTLALTVWYAYL